MKKKAILLAVVLFLFSGCAKNGTTSTESTVKGTVKALPTAKIGAMKNESAVIFGSLIEKNEARKANIAYTVNFHDNIEKAENALISESEITVMPIAEALHISKESAGAYKILAVTQQNNIFAFSADTLTADDFSDKKLLVYESAELESAIKKLTDVNYDKFQTPAELKNMMNENNYDIIISPQPVGAEITSYKKHATATAINTLIDVNLSTSCVVTSVEKFITEGELFELFEKDLTASVNEAVSGCDASQQILKNYDICNDEANCENAVKNCGGVYLNGEDAVNAVDEYIKLCELANNYKNATDYVIVK